MRNNLLILLAIIGYIAADKAAVWKQPEETSYTEEQRDEMDKLVGFAIGQSDEVVLYPKPTLRQRQAQTLAEVYGIDETNLDSYKEWW